MPWRGPVYWGAQQEMGPQTVTTVAQLVQSVANYDVKLWWVVLVWGLITYGRRKERKIAEGGKE